MMKSGQYDVQESAGGQHEKKRSSDPVKRSLCVLLIVVILIAASLAGILIALVTTGIYHFPEAQIHNNNTTTRIFASRQSSVNITRQTNDTSQNERKQEDSIAKLKASGTKSRSVETQIPASAVSESEDSNTNGDEEVLHAVRLNKSAVSFPMSSSDGPETIPLTLIPFAGSVAPSTKSSTGDIAGNQEEFTGNEVFTEPSSSEKEYAPSESSTKNNESASSESASNEENESSESKSKEGSTHSESLASKGASSKSASNEEDESSDPASNEQTESSESPASNEEYKEQNDSVNNPLTNEETYSSENIVSSQPSEGHEEVEGQGTNVPSPNVEVPSSEEDYSKSSSNSVEIESAGTNVSSPKEETSSSDEAEKQLMSSPISERTEQQSVNLPTAPSLENSDETSQTESAGGGGSLPQQSSDIVKTVFKQKTSMKSGLPAETTSYSSQEIVKDGKGVRTVKTTDPSGETKSETLRFNVTQNQSPPATQSNDSFLHRARNHWNRVKQYFANLHTRWFW